MIVKHANPCGVAVAGDLAEAHRLAHACDPVSAFGGIVAVNRPVDDEMAAWDRFAVDAWPTMVLIDRRGVVRAVHVGDDTARTIESELMRLLDEK